MDVQLFLEIFMVTFIVYGVTGIGGIFSERSGTFNIALEGGMVIGAFVFSITNYYLGSGVSSIVDLSWGAIFLGLIFAVIAGMIFSLILSITTIHFRADHTIIGTAMNLLAPAITLILTKALIDQNYIDYVAPSGSWITELWFGIPAYDFIFFIIGVIVIVIAWFFLNKTIFGLRLKAAGENPHALAATGISVVKMRYIGITLSGGFAALGGAIAMTTLMGQHYNGTVAGMGFIALALMIMGQWKIGGLLIGSFIFAIINAIIFQYVSLSWINWMPESLVEMLPFIVPILILMLFKSASPPAASGKPYDKQER